MVFSNFSDYLFLNATKGGKKIIENTFSNIVLDNEYRNDPADFRNICNTTAEVKRNLSLAIRLAADGSINICGKAYTEDEFLSVFITSINSYGHTYYPIPYKIRSDLHQAYWFIKNNGCYTCSLVGYVSAVIQTPTLNVQQKKCISETAFREQTAKSWLELVEINPLDNTIYPEQLLAVSSGNPLNISFSGRNPYIICI